ncbi:MAG TPA: YkvA family protein [Candidatus Margulisiibacteriota bacterium]|nr:YkvA family protein [Candidatus Margulisiibacteriota bacterium]
MIVHELANRIAPADITALLQAERGLRQRAAGLQSDHLQLLAEQLALALDCLRDHVDGACPQIPYYTISLLAAAVSYFADELDVIPDFLPHIGQLDDAVVMAMAYELGHDGLRRYCAWKGRDAHRVLPAGGTPTSC